MKDINKMFSPEINCGKTANIESKIELDATKKTSCPCCGYLTIPNNGDALAYICPICFWEIDTFISSENEESDQNHGLTLVKAKQNLKKFGAVLPHLKKHCRQPIESEYPTK
ncbi:CPCC family cysteine-rich protein [Brassicibacter mesophilus]|uniref:CPCC family cysteine-rich protein n=1 Tax=Brassicibacter mesophilus TaxID=745119 RepID=UPI003D2188D6